jgi:NAD(P)-dependent dehydrogenase (short-subunit alcohol dehydrogenase family)
MKIIVVGGTGTLGKAIVTELKQRHEVIAIGHSSGDLQVDVTSPSSIEKMYQAIGKVDAVIAATGNVHFGTLPEFTAEQYQIGLQGKLMGQVHLVLIGLKYIADNGSFTLTSGILNHDPIRFGSSAAMVNGALEGFIKGAAIEMPKNARINLVSPTVLLESMSSYAQYFRGYEPVPAARAALAYSKSVEGLQTGQIYKVGF